MKVLVVKPDEEFDPWDPHDRERESASHRRTEADLSFLQEIHLKYNAGRLKIKGRKNCKSSKGDWGAELEAHKAICIANNSYP